MKKIISTTLNEFLNESKSDISNPSLANALGYSNSDIDKIRKEDREKILADYGEYYCVFDFKNKTMFSPKDNNFYTTNVFAIIVPFKHEIDAWNQLDKIENWMKKSKIKNTELSVITLNTANEILYKNK